MEKDPNGTLRGTIKTNDFDAGTKVFIGVLWMYKMHFPQIPQIEQRRFSLIKYPSIWLRGNGLRSDEYISSRCRGFSLIRVPR